ncbi:hypothetical protein Tco_0163960 [Tanacetum coccineum]
MRIEESLNVTFDESLPEPKSSSSVKDDRIDEPIVQDLNGSPSLQVNVSDKGYPKSLKEARVSLNNQVSSLKSVLDNKALEDSSSNADIDEDWHNVEDNEENRDMLSSINEAIKLMLAITINMSPVIENYIRKEESKDNLNEYFEDYYSEDQYAVSIKEDTTYLCLHSPKTTRNKAQYAVLEIWNQYNILEDIKRDCYSKKSPIRQYSEDEEAEAMAKTMKQYMSKTRTDYGSGVARPKIDNKDQFKLKGQFLKDFGENTFSGSDNEDANEHIEKVLEIVDLFYVPNITVDQLMLRIFPISLTGAASRWLRNKPTSSIKT